MVNKNIKEILILIGLFLLSIVIEHVWFKINLNYIKW